MRDLHKITKNIVGLYELNRADERLLISSIIKRKKQIEVQIDKARDKADEELTKAKERHNKSINSAKEKGIKNNLLIIANILNIDLYLKETKKENNNDEH